MGKKADMGLAMMRVMCEKGITELTWVYITLALLLVFVSFAISPLFAAMDVAARNSAQIQAMEMAGIISMMKTSDAKSFTYKLRVPTNCVINVNDKFVNVITTGKKETSGIFGIVESGVKVNKAEINCEQGEVWITKSGNSISVR